jgi:hypothetical protein
MVAGSTKALFPISPHAQLSANATKNDENSPHEKYVPSGFFLASASDPASAKIS